MKKRIFAAATAAMMTVSALGSVTAGAFEQTSYAEDVSVYVNGQKIDNGQYKPIIVNDRTLVRIVPIFDALDFEHSEMDEYKSVNFVRKGTNETYRFIAEKNYAIGGTGYDEEAALKGEDSSNIFLEVPATLQYNDVFYVPIRSFCDMAHLEIEWDDDTRSVYITGRYLNSSNNKTTSDISLEKALELIKIAYGKDITSHNKVLSQTDSSIEIFDVESKDTNPPMTRCYKVSYNKQDSRYYVLSTSEENFDKSDDENTSCVIVDANNKIVGLAN